MPEFDYTDYGPRYALIPDFPGYRVGTDGSLWSRRGHRWATMRKKWTRVKTKRRDSRGRERVCLYVDGRKLPLIRFLHRIVLQAFVGSCPDGMVCCHENDNSSDNRPCNLRWDTPKNNAADALRNGRYHLGPANRNSRFTEEQIVEIRRAIAAGASCNSLSIITGVSAAAISKIANGKNWAWVKS